MWDQCCWYAGNSLTSKTILNLLQSFLLDPNHTGCRSQIRKIFEFKIWKESMLALKKWYTSKNPLISLILALIWHPESACIFKIEVKKSKTRREFIKCNKICFSQPENMGLLIMPRPLSGCQIKADISFVSVLALVLSENWKRLGSFWFS